MKITRADILMRVQEHYDYLVAAGYEVMVTILQGSQNYGLDEYSEEYMSDVDTKSIVLPSFNDFVENKRPVSKVEVMENNEHARVEDIRLMLQMFKKEKINYIELLYSNYVIVNPKYEKYWQELVSKRDEIVAANSLQFVKCIAGMSLEKRKALCHPYPNLIEKIEKYGYDGKQLSHCVRLWEFLFKYLILQKPVKECFKSSMREILMDLKKQQLNGKVLAVDDAVKMCDYYCAEIGQLKECYSAEERSLDGISASAILRERFREELKEDE